MGKLLIVGIIAAVIVIETSLAFIFIPDSKQVTAQFRAEIRDELAEEFGGANAKDLLGDKGEEKEELLEKELGV